MTFNLVDVVAAPSEAAGHQVTISTDKNRLDRAKVLQWLRTTGWAADLTEGRLNTAIEHSECVGAYATDGEQVGFARLVTDYASFGFLTDVFVEQAWRGHGLATRLTRELVDGPAGSHLRHIALLTGDVRGLYARLGFGQPHPDFWMERFRSDPSAEAAMRPPAS
jgi:predicted GNAT family acetyltransferase